MKTLVLLLLLFGGGASVAASQPRWPELKEQWLQQIPAWTYLKVEARVQVFDPSHEPSHQSPVELPERSFRQIIYLQSEGPLAIETLSLEGTLLALYYEDHGEFWLRHVQSHRFFSAEDLVGPIWHFFTRNPAQLERALREWNILPKEISFFFEADYSVGYRLGSAESWAWVDLAEARLRGLQRQIHQSGQERLLRVAFSKFQAPAPPGFPQVTDFFWEGKLFKRITLESWQNPPQLPLASLLRQVVLARPAEFSLETNDTR